MTTLLQDVRYAWRVLRKAPLTSGVAVVTLALGIGATAAIFSVIDAVLLRPLPGIAAPDRLATIGRTVDGAGFDNSSFENYVDLREETRTFSDVAAAHSVTVTLSTGREADRISGAIVSSNYFRTFAVAFAAGHGFNPVRGADEAQSGPAVAVISHAIWVQRFSSDPAVVGRTMSLNGQRFEIIGVTAERFGGVDARAPQDVWMPISAWRTPKLLPSFFRETSLFHKRDAAWLLLYARMRPGVTLEQARADVQTIAARLQSYPDNRKNGWSVAPGAGLQPADRRDLVRVTQMLFGAVAVLLLLACANVANLSLARAAARVHEVSVRLAIGASRARLVRQLLTESALIALMGGAAGLAVADVTSGWLAALLARSTHVAPNLDLSPDVRVVLFAFGMSGLTALLFGVGPALRSSRADLGAALKEAVAVAPRHSVLRRGLVAVQLTLSLVLLIGAGLLLRTIQAFNAIDTGVNARDITIATIEPSITGKYDEARMRRFCEQLLPRVQAIPGVQAAALGRVAPVTSRGYAVSARVLDRPGGFTESQGLQFNTVSANYFGVMGIPIVRGRVFNESDRASAPPVVIVNDAAARRIWPGEDPIHKQILLQGEPLPREVVGVVATIKSRSLLESARPLAYYAISQAIPMPEAPVVIHVRTRLATAQLGAALEHEVQALDPELPVFAVKRLSDHIGESYWQQQTVGSVTGVLALLALALGSIGMYGVMAFAAAARTQEIGVRMALGATASRVLGMFVLDAARLVLVAAAAGVIVALLLSRVLAALLLGVDQHDPLTFAGATVVLGGTALAAAFVPALRASRVDPMLALRRE